jgi:hypothetical protein
MSKNNKHNVAPIEAAPIEAAPIEAAPIEAAPTKSIAELVAEKHATLLATGKAVTVKEASADVASFILLALAKNDGKKAAKGKSAQMIDSCMQAFYEVTNKGLTKSDMAHIIHSLTDRNDVNGHAGAFAACEASAKAKAGVLRFKQDGLYCVKGV